MGTLFVVAGVLVAAIVVVGWLSGSGRKVEPWDAGDWTVDPLDLQPLGEKTACVFVSALPIVGRAQEMVPLVVNADNRPKFLRFGPAAFVHGLGNLGLLERSFCLVGRDRATAQPMPLDTLRQKLFGEFEPSSETVRMIHDLTEVDLTSVEDGEAIRAHIARLGFELLPTDFPPKQDTSSSHTLKI